MLIYSLTPKAFISETHRKPITNSVISIDISLTCIPSVLKIPIIYPSIWVLNRVLTIIGMHTCVEGSKRQLPPWMMQKKVGASHVSNSGNAVETNCSTENGDIIEVNERKKDQKKETSRKKSNPNAKCEVKRRGSLDQQNGSSDNITQKKKKKKGNICRDRTPRSSIKKRKKLEDLSHGCSDDPVQASSGDDDVELTVEDLMAIAEQYVKDYENKERHETTSRQCESKRKCPATSGAGGTTLDAPCENKKSFSSEREALYNSALTTGELIIPTSTSQTDHHPAQDMLDVFLGPLLRKTLEKEEEEKSKSSLESVEITHEFMRQSQNEHVVEETVPLIKKRNTMKDKVAMFLD